jgi:hypothetical protein
MNQEITASTCLEKSELDDNAAISRSEQRGMEQPWRNDIPPQLAALAVM